jgi:glucose 1-dehydrogenase/3-oxoacyl-[acyl-carrier protein] reductase
MNSATPLAGKRALVTGAGKGIGRGVALALAEAGAELVVHYRSNPAEAESLIKEIGENGGSAWSVAADLGDTAQLDAMFATIRDRWGALDIAVNNAGWDPGYVDFQSIDEDLYRRLSDVNIKGTLFCCLREIDLMRGNPGGCSIINIGSVQQDTSVPGRTLYAMSKGAIHAMTGQLALECGPLGIRLNNVAPGYIEVERMSKVDGFDRDEVAADIPIGRIGNVADVGAFAVYLASPGAGFITGQTLVIDGGVSRKLARSRISSSTAPPVDKKSERKPKKRQTQNFGRQTLKEAKQ